MKISNKITLLLASVLLVMTANTSCEFGDDVEPDHPSYVTYTISASSVSFDGPDQLLLDINYWIRQNQIVYDTQVSYKSGEASEFTKTDTEAIKKYENDFVPKFRSYLLELKTKLDAGTYGTGGKRVLFTFAIFAKRAQGKDGTLKYDEITFNYPDGFE